MHIHITPGNTRHVVTHFEHPLNVSRPSVTIEFESGDRV